MQKYPVRGYKLYSVWWGSFDSTCTLGTLFNPVIKYTIMGEYHKFVNAF